MATLKTFLFDYDFDDVELVKNLTQEEIDSKNDGNTSVQVEPEIILPTFSEDELNAARQEGFNSGKESGMTEALGSIENSISQTLETIVNEILDLSRKQSEFNEHIKVETISLLNCVNRKLFPLMNERLNLDEAIQFSQKVLPELLTEPRIIIRVDEGISESLRNRIEAFLKDKGYGGELIVNGDAHISEGNCQIEWSSGSAERDSELLISDVEKHFLNAINSNTYNDKTILTGEIGSKTDNQKEIQPNMINDAEPSDEELGDKSRDSESRNEEILTEERQISKDKNSSISDDHS